MIYLFTGNGKGKTTSAFGTALRALAQDKTVHIIQFFKNKDWFEIGEVKFLESLELGNLTIESFGRKGWVNFKKPVKGDVDIAQKALKRAEKLLKSKPKPFLIILDEINVALGFDILQIDEIKNLFKLARKNNIHLILTGRQAPEELFDEVDVITEMKEVKHIYEDGKGQEAIKGLEY
jgi:cob(I)alamin adenosyltransferase